MMALLTALLQGCALPPLEGRTESRALAPAEAAATALGRVLSADAQAHPGESGILPLADALESFAARVLLVRAAERTLDVQYYIWRDDITGNLLLNALREAADRGVRVRLLLDDNGVAMDGKLLALDRHPAIEVRLFNPFSIRQPKALGYLTHFSRANRRMHNKALVADSQAAIMGGRNVGDEYFGATDGVLFADLDVLATGAVVPELSTDFDRYWASASAYPIDRIVPAGTAVAAPDAVAQAERDPRATRYLQALRGSRFVSDLLTGGIVPQWARVEMVSDDPRKGLGLAEKEGLVTHQLAQVLARPPVRSLDLISPYFVPTAAGVAVFERLAARGVRVRILTNALEATDVSAVHSGYARYRQDLLRCGIELYEMRRSAVVMGRSGVFGSSGSSLHAKTFALDGERVFVGSMNFDPRSAHLNTELGFIIDSPAMARAVADAFDREVPATAYAVRLDEQGDLVWIERRDGQEIRHTREPGSSLGQRAWIGLLSVLPIEWLL
ncbi:MAG: phospholipase D family protein [Hydrogenophaga sp.]|uniref:phospholipase D family protein n=1 Tax=Hydrogenophaga sp. TaxID=1904254 RepID=UPI0025C66899|nr:phospholipase D family protein [Hydrogenophaga sp.]MBU7575345.1 phospholipase D family protein [Hydrogenophaga sp.]